MLEQDGHEEEIYIWLKSLHEKKNKALLELMKKEADTAHDEEAEAAKTGTFTIITEATGRYYVVIESFVDSDMATDYGNKLAADGVGSTLLSPEGKRKFHRLTIGDYDSFVDAQEEANKMKTEYGDDLWVLKY